MKKTDEIPEAAEKVADKYIENLKGRLSEYEQDSIKKWIEDGFIAGYSQALKDARHHFMVG